MCVRTAIPGRLGLLPVLLLLLACCTVRWVSDYDEVTDRDATALLKETVAHLETLRQEAGNPAAEYGNHRIFYAGANVSVGALRRLWGK